ncbi:MAG: ABC transporter ATP-binding protein [Balneolaceae bacterium]
MSNKKNSEAVDSRLIRRLYFFLKPYRWYVLLAIGLTLAASYLGTIRPKLTQIAVDDYIAYQDFEGLWWIITLLGAALLGEFILLVFNTYLTRWFGQNSLYFLRNTIFKKIQLLNVQFFDKNPIGRLITRTTSDIEALSELLSDGVVNIVGDMFRIIFILYFMFTMSWELSLVTIAVLPILFYATFWFKAKVRVSFLEVRDKIAQLNSFVQEHINGMDIVQLFNREKKQAEKFENINAGHRKAYIETIFYFAIFWPIVEVVASLAMALIVWYGGARALMDGVTFGVLLAFIQYARQFFQPIRGLSEKFNTLQSALASSERIFNVLDTKTTVIETEHPKKITDPKGKIEFENVWFRYNETEEYVLKDVSFTAEPGDDIAIVGATGAGKTTIINLLFRFYDIERGSIKLDGVDIRDLTLHDLRSHFGLVLQDNALFSGSVLENITLGHPDITRKEVVDASKKVEAHRFIDKLPETYDFVLRERGASLSMGQRQLICFVRALVFNPEILILDEATSSVDSETEALVNAASKVMMEGRTSVVVAHRLSTIQFADKILVMHKGEIREAGTHQELILQEKGIYKKLYELQYKDQLVAG